MVNVYNTSVFNEALKFLNVRDAQFFDNNIGNKLNLVYQIPILSQQNRYITATSTGSQTIYTTPAEKDFYLTSATVSIIKDATCDMATGAVVILVTVNGVQSAVIGISTLTLTAQSDSVSVSFKYPIKIDRSSTVVMGGTFTAGACVRTGCITGFLSDTLQY